MVDGLRLHIGELRGGLDELRVAAELVPDARGAHLGTVVLHGVDTLLTRLDKAEAQMNGYVDAAGANPLAVTERELISRKLTRLEVQVENLYDVLTAFGPAVGRGDLPIGLEYLLAVVLRELTSRPADPLIFMNSTRMYATMDLHEWLLRKLTENGEAKPLEDYNGPLPIAFFLPALDPSNALLAPILVHEVAHSAVRESLQRELEQRIGPAILTLLDHHLDQAGLQGDATAEYNWGEHFRNWTSELMCDAVALLTAGPGFSLALASFAPPRYLAIVDTHPYPADRYALQLWLIEQAGWGDVASKHFSEVVAWLAKEAQKAPRCGTAEEGFLLEAISVARPAILEVASGHVGKPLDPAESAQIVEDLAAWLAEGVPVIETNGRLANAWQIVLAGWVVALGEPPDVPVGISAATRDRDFNQLLIKCLELSSIVTHWRQSERADT